MPQGTADLFDDLYAFRDHRGEAERALALVRSAAERPIGRMLDVGCATGEETQWYVRAGVPDVHGIDVDGALLARAKKKVARATFHRGDFASIRLRPRFDAVVALYGVVAYTVTPLRLLAFAQSVARHLAPGGAALVEPWRPGETRYRPRLSARIVERPGVRIARVSAERLRGSVAHIDVHYLVAREGRVGHRREALRLGVFSRADHVAALRAAGLRVRWEPNGIGDRGGVFVAVNR